VCALNHLDKDMQFPFIDCFERTISVFPYWVNMYLPFWVDMSSRICSKKLGIDMGAVDGCIGSDEGTAL